MRKIELASGHFLVTEFSATGGVSYSKEDERTETQGDAESATYQAHKRIDHVGVVQVSKKIIAAAYSAMERHAVRNPVGWWVSEAKLAALQAELAQCQQEAENLNRLARGAGSARRVSIDVLEIVLAGESGAKVAQRLAQTVRERLGEIRQALATGDLKLTTELLRKARTLRTLAVGMQAETIDMALDCAKTVKESLAEARKADPKALPTDDDLGPIDSAIVLFTDRPEVDTQEVAA